MIRRALFLIGVAIFVYLIFLLGVRPIIDMVRRVGWGLLLLAVLNAAYQMVRAWALQRSLVQPNGMSLGDAIWVRVSSQAFEVISLAGPFVAIPARGWLARERGVTTQQGYAASITEYLIYTFLSAALSIAALIYLLAHFTVPRVLVNIAASVLSAMTIFLVVSAVAIWRRFYLIGTLIQIAARLVIVRRRLKPDMNWINRMEDLLLAVLRDRPRQFATVAGIDLLAHGLLTFELYLIMRMLRLSFPLVYPFLIDAGTKFAAVAFFLIPGQIGASEGTYAATFAILQLPAAGGFAVALIRRIRSLIVAGAGLLAIARIRATGADPGLPYGTRH